MISGFDIVNHKPIFEWPEEINDAGLEHYHRGVMEMVYED
jgi:hypothetical protein